jgi:hypothetical protein
MCLARRQGGEESGGKGVETTGTVGGGGAKGATTEGCQWIRCPATADFRIRSKHDAASENLTEDEAFDLTSMPVSALAGFRLSTTKK